MRDTTAILVVEDEPDHAQFIRDTLEGTRIPMTLCIVNSGEEAIAYLSGEGKFLDRESYPLPCLILLDLRMPGIGGFGVLRWLCARPLLKESLNLVVLSSVQSSQEIEVVYELGAQHFWLKSDSQMLQDRVRVWHETWLGNGRQARLPKRARPDRRCVASGNLVPRHLN